MLARRTKIFINGVEAAVKSFKYTDNVDKADTAEVAIYDENKNILRTGVPRGGKYQFELRQDIRSFNCGLFSLDKISYKSPSECTLKFNSVAGDANLRGSIKNRAWEQTNLRKIAADIAADGGLSLFYDAPTIEITRAEQNESGLSFLNQLCKRNGLSLKVANGKLIIFSASNYESKSAVATINLGDENILRYNFDCNATDIYSAANVNFNSNGIADWLFSFFGINNLISAKFSSESGGSQLNINERVDSLAQAEILSKAKLREKNQNEFTCTFELAGDFNYRAGSTINIVNFGMFSGRYLIESATHSVSNGYTLQIKLHKCLGY